MDFSIQRISEHITRVIAFNTEMMYLVQGGNKAALIDTGSGFGSLRACIAELTDLPVIVLLTHGHTDHAMGTAEFDTVYMNHADDATFAVHGGKEFRLSSLDLSSHAAEIAKLPYIETDDCNRFLQLNAGDCFDLGDIHIDIFGCKGHTAGSLCMLIREERALLLGDACNGLTFLFDEFATGVREYRDSLVKLKIETDGKYDVILLSHTGGEPRTDMIESNIAVCGDILSGNTDDQPFEFKGMKLKLAKAFSFGQGRLDGGSGNIVYSDDTKSR